ncbi:MAG: hypothetical protein HUU57_16535 [Bdellovibrio sp.]|nr:hypothetical protein [Bdellovibrio sp.]
MSKNVLPLCLLLGCFIFAGHLCKTEQKNLRTPQSVAPVPTAIGSYSFVSGTDACPKEVEWRAECGGFTLNIEDASSAEAQAHRFCNVNKGKQISREKVDHGNKNTKVEVLRQDNLISRTEVTTFTDKGTSVELQREDTVIIDDTGKFLWEHSEDGKGHSCLYSRYSK